ncbi:MAG: ComEC/Rec2 family competence protein [Spirochaetota bacterium]
MEEYKRIANLILVPSFFSLLLACTIIFSVYSCLFDLHSNTAIGIFITLLSLLLFILFIRRTSRSFFNAFIPVIICLVIVIQILLQYRTAPINLHSHKFMATIESVKDLRYSSEVELSFYEQNVNPSGFFQMINSAVTYLDKDIKVNPGDKIEIHARPKEIIPGNKNSSSFETDLFRKGVKFIFYLNRKNFKIIKNAPPVLKDSIRISIENNLLKLFEKKTVPVLKGLYFANGSYVDKSTTADFKRAGALHILAASGEHIGIIAGALLIALSPLLINRKILRIMIALVVLFYLFITDMPVSLLRAFVMFYVFSIQYIFDLEKNIFNTLFISAVIILAIHPYELYSLGFQLSFGATFGIILFFNFYKNAFSSLPSVISKALAVTLSAQTFVLPVIFLRLNEINLAGLFSNIVLVFSMSWMLILSVAANVISVFAIQPAEYFAFFTDGLYSISLQVIKYFSGINGHFAITGSKSALLLLPYLLFLLPVIPVKLNKKLFPLSVCVSVVSAWAILSYNYSVNANNIALLEGNSRIIIVQTEKVDPVMFGQLHSIEEADIIAGYCCRNNIRNITLCIPVPDYKNLKNYTYLIKKIIVSKCRITSDFMFSGNLNKFCRILDADGIKLNIAESAGNKRNVFNPNNINKSLKNILASPHDNIIEINNLFFQGYESKNSIIEEVINSGYNIEYLGSV